MKKIMISTLVVLSFVFCAQYASACSQNQGSATGGACSIKELQNLEKSKPLQDENLKTEKDLQTAKVDSEKQKQTVECKVFGLCLRQRLSK